MSRVDRTDSGEVCVDPALGADPIALLIYDRGGNFAAQFMRRDRSAPTVAGYAAASNNTQAQGGAVDGTAVTRRLTWERVA